MTEKTGFSRALWLQLLRQGGRMTTAELAAEIDADPIEIKALLFTLARSKFVTKYGKTPTARRVTFGITAASRVPTNVRLQDLLENGLQLGPEAHQ